MSDKSVVRISKNLNKDPKLLLSCRLSFFTLCLFATFNFILLRANINFALVCMIKPIQYQNNITLKSNNVSSNDSLNPNIFGTLDQVDIDDTCSNPKVSNSTHPNDLAENSGVFEWDKEVQGNILGSFYYGYVATTILGGWLSDRFGSRGSFISSVGMLSFLTILNPIAANQGVGFLFSVRLIQGISQGAAIPLLNVLAARWCGNNERSFLMSIAYGGFTLGGFISNPLCAFLCKYLGWEYIFYVPGAIGLVWCFVSYFLLYAWPEDHPRISQVELEFLQKHRALHPGSKNLRKGKTPWKSILLSIPINTIYVCHFCTIWSFMTLSIYIPQYFKEILKMDIRKNGSLSSVPFLGMLIIHFFAGSIFDKVNRKQYVSVTTLRKIFNTIGLGTFGICLGLISLIPCGEKNIVTTIMIFVPMSLWELALLGGYFLSVFELAPKYAGLITGITNAFAVFPGFLCPALSSYIIKHGTKSEFLTIFYIASCMVIFGSIIYLLFGSSELQNWAKDNSMLPSKELEVFPVEQELILNQVQNENLNNSMLPTPKIDANVRSNDA